MWTERRPIAGETIKVEFAEFTKLGTQIGVFLGTKGGKDIIDFGDRNRWLNTFSSYLVWQPDLLNSTQ